MFQIAKAGRTLELREGRLVTIPIVHDLLDAMDVLGKIRGKTAYKDKADLAFDLTGDSVRVTEMKIVTTVAAVRGTGDIFYDGRLDMLVNAGPMEKVQSMLGEIGDILGKVTDQLVKYDVEGTVSDPSVTARPLGIGG